MKVSVIIPFRENSGEFLEKKLQGLFSGQFKDFEVIVVDDSSPFPAEEIVKNYPQVKLIKLENSPPFNMAAARNRGADIAEGEFLCFTDTDVVFNSDLLEKLINPDKDVIYGRVKKESGEICFGITHFALIKKDFFVKIGGFDEGFVGNYGYDDVFLQWKVDRFKGKAEHREEIVADMLRLDKGSHAPNKGELTIKNRDLFMSLTYSYDYIIPPSYLVNYPGFLSEDDIKVLGHFALDARRGIVEIGSLAGKSAKVFLHFSDKPLTCIDPYLPIERYLSEMSLEEAERLFRENVVDKYPDRVRFIKKPSNDAIYDIEQNSFDLLFIDGDHSYEQAKSDFFNYSAKIEKPGIIIFHDYHHKDYPGITQVVDEIIEQKKAEKVLFTQSIAVVKA